jgi:hypothetical protein
MSRRWIAVAVCGAVLAVAAGAQAQGRPGAVRVGLGATILSWTEAHYRGTDPRTGEPREEYGTLSKAGLTASSIGVDFGYALGEVLVVGGYADVARRSEASEDPSDTADSTTLWLLPYLELVLLPGSRFRPAIAGIFGLSYWWFQQTTPGSEQDLTYLAPALGLRAAVHLFATETFSISPVIGMLYSWGTTHTPTREIEQTNFWVTFGFELAGWVGGDRPSSPQAGGPAR